VTKVRHRKVAAGALRKGLETDAGPSD
jgi:hypothetical protein